VPANKLSKSDGHLRKTNEQKQAKQARTLANLMGIKGNGWGCPRGPYHKPPKPVATAAKITKTNKNEQILWKSTEMVGGAPGGPYQKQRKPLSKNNHNKQKH
jgi:hypothetical protein